MQDSYALNYKALIRQELLNKQKATLFCDEKNVVLYNVSYLNPNNKFGVCPILILIYMFISGTMLVFNYFKIHFIFILCVLSDVCTCCSLGIYHQRLPYPLELDFQTIVSHCGYCEPSPHPLKEQQGILIIVPSRNYLEENFREFI